MLRVQLFLRILHLFEQRMQERANEAGASGTEAGDLRAEIFTAIAGALQGLIMVVTEEA